jgi:lytic murein transglycosylase
MGLKLRKIVAAAALIGLSVGTRAQQLPYTPEAAAPAPEPAPAPPPSVVGAIEPPLPEPVDSAFNAFLLGVRAQAIAAGVKAETFDRETAGLTPNPRVVRFDRAQPGGNPATSTPGSMDFAPYRRQHVDRAHIDKGRARYQALRPLLADIEKRTGVSEAIAMAIFGHETGYGSFSGNFDLIRSLATLAYEGRRGALFTAELIATLKLIDQGMPRSRLVGSWAGATGFPQFLPSVYLRLGRDGDGDGKADIWASDADALASIGAYLTEAGWKPDTVWGVAVRVPGGFDRTTIASPLLSPRCPRVHVRLSRWLTMAEWKARGIMVAGYPAPKDDELVQLIEPDGPDATAYLLTTNYRAILDYNCSNFYALSVGLLADEITR